MASQGMSNAFQSKMLRRTKISEFLQTKSKPMTNLNHPIITALTAQPGAGLSGGLFEVPLHEPNKPRLSPASPPAAQLPIVWDVAAAPVWSVCSSDLVTDGEGCPQDAPCRADCGEVSGLVEAERDSREVLNVFVVGRF